MMISTRALTRVAIGLTFAACALAVFAADAPATDASAAASCSSPVYSQMQLRVLDRATQGPGALRRYVGIVQPIRQTDYAETVAWLDGERDRFAGCRAAALRQTTASR
jgi:hypothetical protein